MSLRARILGCGTSSGVPRIGGDWGQCDPANPRNRRTRASILIESDTTRLLVDTSPDMRAQLLDAGLIDIDSVFWTHDHADHCHGLDDLRQIAHHRRQAMAAYAPAQALAQLQSRFAYAFEGREGYPPIVAATPLGEAMDSVTRVGDIEVRWVAQPHGDIYSAGYLFSAGGNSIAYATDFHEVTPDMIAFFQKADHWIVDALRERPHPTHAHLALTLAAIEQVRPGRAWLTHMDQSMDYDSLCAMLPETIRPAYDGLLIEA